MKNKKDVISITLNPELIRFIKKEKVEKKEAMFIHNEQEMKKYYDEAKRAYVFNNGVFFTEDINVKDVITAKFVRGKNIVAGEIIVEEDITGENIKAEKILAQDVISTGSVTVKYMAYEKRCFVNNKLTCEKIINLKGNEEVFVLEAKDGE